MLLGHDLGLMLAKHIQWANKSQAANPFEKNLGVQPNTTGSRRLWHETS